jgi:hypothetical protein
MHYSLFNNCELIINVHIKCDFENLVYASAVTLSVLRQTVSHTGQWTEQVTVCVFANWSRVGELSCSLEVET